MKFLTANLLLLILSTACLTAGLQLQYVMGDEGDEVEFVDPQQCQNRLCMMNDSECIPYSRYCNQPSNCNCETAMRFCRCNP
ncbi:MAG: hypothetical protein KatS3mg110_2939 [Pirellulaceae bacterium]|nr:MAG: hypothetical protein KatS3mg110_2939 [Pirellulaceae bacterium]